MQFNLNQFPYDKCPECGAPAVAASVQYDRFSEKPKITEHCHSGQWQYLDFACGARHSSTPSPIRINIERPCRNTPAHKAKIEARHAAITYTVSWVNKLASKEGTLANDQDFVKRLIENITNTRVE